MSRFRSINPQLCHSAVPVTRRDDPSTLPETKPAGARGAIRRLDIPSTHRLLHHTPSEAPVTNGDLGLQGDDRTASESEARQRSRIEEGNAGWGSGERERGGFAAIASPSFPLLIWCRLRVTKSGGGVNSSMEGLGN